MRLTLSRTTFLLGGLLYSSGSYAQMPPSAVGMPMVAPLFVEDSRLSSLLTVVNNASIAENADVVLRDAKGQQITKQTIALAAHSKAEIAVADMLEAVGSSVTMGSVEVVSSDENMTVAAQLSISGRNPASPLHLEEELVMPMAAVSNVRRATATSVLGSPILVLKGLSSTEQTVTVDCLDENGAVTEGVVSVRPGGLVLWPACVTNATAAHSLFDDSDHDEPKRRTVGLSVTTTGSGADLVIYGIGLRSHDSDGSMYTPINFSDPSQARSSSTIFTGVPVGPTDPMLGTSFEPELGVTNFGRTSANVTVRYSFSRHGDVENNPVAHVVVPPLSALTISLPHLAADTGMRNSFIIESSAQPGDLSASLRSVGGSTPWVSEVIGLDEKQMDDAGLHPWTAEQGTISTLLLFNHTQAKQAFHVLIAAGATIWQKKYTLTPFETRAININSLIANVERDDLGHTLPENSVGGELGWFTEAPELGTGRLLETRPEEFLARGFNCHGIVVLCGASNIPTSVGILENATTGVAAVGQWCMTSSGGCSGSSTTSAGSDQTSWSVSSGVLSIQGPSTSNSVTLLGAAVGRATATARVFTTSCSFAAQTTITVSPRIKQGATDITNHSQDVIVGQEISLFAEIPLSGNSITSQSWTIPGTIVAGYTANANTGTVSSLVAKSGSSVLFYWVDGADGRQVQYQATLNDGRTYKAVTTFNVKPVGWTQNNLSHGSVNINSTCYSFLAMCYGSNTFLLPGMRVQITVTPPTGFSGNYGWTQIVSGSASMKNKSTGQIATCGVNGVDTPTTTTVPPLNQNSNWDDTPAMSLVTNGSLSEESETNSFVTYLMFQPSGNSANIWVPLAQMSWSWSGDSINSGGTTNSGWVLNSSSAPAPTSLSATTSFPVWTQNALATLTSCLGQIQAP